MMNKEELFKKKGEAHTQIELWQEVLRHTNVELNKVLFPQKEGANGQAIKAPDTPRPEGK